MLLGRRLPARGQRIERAFHPEKLAQDQYPLPVLRAKPLIGDDRGLIR
jgi:hypothetical protein